jgi:hypothetical protein
MKHIQFIPTDPESFALGKPRPAKDVIASWYKKGELTFTGPNGSLIDGMKACIPFLDVMISGYVLVTPIDITVTLNEDGTQSVNWDGPECLRAFVGERPKALGSTIPRPAGHSPNGLVWSSRWGWKTPRGWSTLVTHPFNRHDLPFTTLNAFMESDTYIGAGNIPFFLKEGFSGVIPAGTPFAQLIPVKRATWSHSVSYGMSKVAHALGGITRANNHFYKRKHWVRKKYE